MVIACIISFIVGAMLMICAIGMMAIQKDKRPRNKAHFYVTCEKNIITGGLIRTLWIGMPRLGSQGRWTSSVWGSILAVDGTFLLYNLHLSDFEDMKDGEIKEVFLNLED